MEETVVTDLAVISFEGENSEGWRFQVIAGGGPFPVMATPIQARLGSQKLEGIQVSPDGTGFGGYIQNLPQDGDKLFFNYPGQEEVETEVAYRELQV